MTTFGRIYRGWFDDVFATDPSTLPDILFHYTDAAGLIGALTTGKVWATDYRFLNDKAEIQHSKEVAKGIVSDQRAKGRRKELIEFYDRVLDLQRRDSDTIAFMFSLSQEADDLSQWRGYAKEGEGFTIGFRASSIYDLSAPDDAEFGFCKVEYDHVRQSEALRKCLNDMKAKLLSEIRDSPGAANSLIQEASGLFNRMINERAASNKHQSFRGENEWRAIALVHEPTARPGLVKVRSSGNRLIRYLELDLAKKEEKLPIEKIGIGPGFIGNQEVFAVRALCEQTGYKPKIYYADTPYRRR